MCNLIIPWKNGYRRMIYLFHVSSQFLAGSISGSMELVSKIRNLHKLLGGTLNPVRMIDPPRMI